MNELETVVGETEPVTSSSPESVGTTRDRRRIGREWLARGMLVYAWIAVIVIYGVIDPSQFLTTLNFQVIFNTAAPLLLLCLALLPSLTSGEIDLSLPGMFGAAGVLLAYLNVNLHVSLALAILAALGGGVLVGAVNAFLIVGLGLGSLVVTLGMSSVLAGVALGLTSLPIAGVSSGLVSAASTRVGGLELVFFYAVIATLLLFFVYRYTPLGRYMFFVGASREVSRLSGIRVTAVRAGTLIFGAVFASIAGIMLVGVQGSADPTAGPTYLLPVFAGGFLGSTAFTPGRFNPMGTLVAVFFLQTGTQGLELLGQSGWVDQAFYGAALIAAVTVTRLVTRDVD